MNFITKNIFVVRHKSIHSCKSAIYFDLDKDTIKRNCNFIFYYNKMDITPTVLNRGNKIILANWPNNCDTYGIQDCYCYIVEY